MISAIGAIYDYFETLATQHVDIKGFYKKYIDEVLSGISGNNIQFPVLVVENFDWRVEQAKDDNASRVISLGFHVINIHKEKGNFDNQVLAEQFCEPIARDIIARIKEDEDLFNDSEFHPVKYFNTDNIQGQFLGRNVYTESQYGVRYQLEIHLPMDLTYNSAKWEIPPGDAANYNYDNN